MELTQLSELKYRDLRNERFDYFITTCGYQPRCTFLAENFNPANARKIVMTIDEQGFLQNRSHHRDIFSNSGFKSYPSDVREIAAIGKLADEMFNDSREELSILVDYSCMPKKWYSVIIDSITRNNFNSKKISLYLSYTPKIPEKAEKKQTVDYFGPVLYSKDQLRNRRPVAMIVSLDNKGRWISEAIQHVKPQEVITFIPVCTYDPEYTGSVKENNQDLLARLDENKIYHYDTTSPGRINTLLTSICLDYRINAEVMIVPQGPKIFSMMALLISVRYPDIKLWEVIGKSHNHIANPGLAASDPVIIKATFLDEEDDLEDPD